MSITCSKCQKSNRQQARFCKWCGTAISIVKDNSVADTSHMPSALDTLIDKDDLKKQLTDLLSKAESMKRRYEARGKNHRIELSFVITGGTGTGKSTVAEVIAQELHARGIISNSAVKVIAASEYNKFIDDLPKNSGSLGNGVIVIDEAEKLVADGEAKDIIPIDHILKYVKQWRGAADKPVVVLCGSNRLKEFFRSNQTSAAAINYFFVTGEISDDGLVEITKRIMQETYNRNLLPESLKKLKRIYVYDRRNPGEAEAAGGHNAARRAYNIELKCQDAELDVSEDKIDGIEYKPKTFDEVLTDFDKYVGVDEIKKSLKEIASQIEEQRRLDGDETAAEIKDHFLFLGNPGTGKTTMARLFADALNALGALPVGHLVEVSRSDLVSQYVGETPKLVTRWVDKAMGGVLFIDEAYSLKNGSSDSFGQEAVDTLLQLAENRRGKFVTILAGYTKEMGEFMQANSGLQSRFNKTVNFRDYKPDELTEIFRRMVKHSREGYILSEDAESRIGQYFDKMYLTRGKYFGNAREVRNVYQRATSSLSTRNCLARETGTFVAGREKVIEFSDIEGTEAKPATVDEILSSFDDMIGMDSVKEQIRTIANKVRLDRKRAEVGGVATQPNIHIMITGNPGTGKTVIAKRMGTIFKAMGVLPKGHVVERERKTLLDSYANSAGANMDKAVDEAMGGVLFIDEAYNLIPMDNPSRDASGVAAIEALMTRMSNDAGKFVVIIAGYKAEIEEFVANANPGLARRFTYHIHINDYSAEDLVAIFKLNAKKERFVLSDEAESLLYKKVEEMLTKKSKTFGNAGEMVKLFAQAKDRQSDRLSKFPDEALTNDVLYTLESADIPYDSPKKIDISECMKELDELVGLHSVKKAVRDLTDTLIVEQERTAVSGGRINVNLDHYLFLGNPGTGKTTVARIMGNIFYTLGLLPSNKVVEVTSKDLIAPYVGQTAKKTEQQIQRSLGGIFFIDEAYSLNDGANGFGKDAMPVLLTSLLDFKGRFVSIAAGYPREMQAWIDTNSGLESRYTCKIFFEDYNGDELAEIFLNIVKKEGFTLEDDAKIEMQKYFSYLVRNKGANFANAREVRNYFDRVKQNQGRRLRQQKETVGIERKDLFVFRRNDMIID